MKRPFLIGELVYLRPLQADDAEHFAEWMNDSRVTRTLRARGPITVETEREWIERAVRDPNQLACALVRRADDRLIGSSGLHGIDWQARSAEFGISIGLPAMWGKGYGTEACRLVTDHAFRTLNLHRVWLRVHADNPAGRRAYEKAGYRLEGIQREAVYREGGYKDMALMGILRPEWDRARADHPKSATATGRSLGARPSRRGTGSARGRKS